MPNYSNDDYNGVTNTQINTQRASGMPTAVNNFNPQDGAANALLQTSTNIFVYSNNSIVGMIQSFRVSESRGINKLQSIGYEGVIQAVPSNSTGGQLDVSRFALYNSNLMSSLGLNTDGKANSGNVGSKTHTTGLQNDTYINGDKSTGASFRTLRDQRVPLEIVVKTPMRGNSTTEYYTERYVDCWLASFSKSYAVGTITVTENATIQYADVF